MARNLQPLLIPEHVVDIIYNGTVPYEIEVTTYQTDDLYTWEVERKDTKFVIVGGWHEYLRECIAKGVRSIFFAMDGANYTVVSTLIT
ncbi:hypothetical protein P8452_27888 [Trifolium repens]|nr:hypothetical protein P8452_27888 [Trifolium repens]